MAKAKKSNSNNTAKNKNKRMLKYFTAATVRAVDDSLEGVEVDDLINNIYLKSEDKDIEYFIKQYEKQLILSKINHNEFEANLHQFYLGMTEYIKTNNLYSKFFELSYLHYITSCKRDVNLNILSGYQNLLIQQYPYLSGTTKKVICGLDKKGKLMQVDEIGKYLTEINFELHLLALKNDNSYYDFNEELFKLCKKYRYNFKEIVEYHELVINDQMITTNLYLMSNFITEDTKDMLPIPFRKPADLVEAHSRFLEDGITNELREKLRHRQFLLPSIGVHAKFKCNGEVTGLFMREIIKNDNLILLFKVEFVDKSFTFGYYDTINEVIYDMYKECSQSLTTHVPLQNIVLQNYLNLTCTLTKEERETLVWFKEIKNLVEKVSGPSVYYELKESKVINNRTQVQVKHFDRSKYIAELMNIQPFLRNLPYGATAGIEAIETAKKLGIELPQGKTLVRGFIKKVYSGKSEE